jgi:hypothetical protein
VTTSNLSGSEVVASTEAFGATYRLTQALPCCQDSAVNFLVFDGVWCFNADPARINARRDAGRSPGDRPEDPLT